MADLVKIPLAFYDDHEARDLDTPSAVKRTKRNAWIDRADPAMAELIDDAKFYAGDDGPSEPRGIKASAAALLAALGV